MKIGELLKNPESLYWDTNAMAVDALSNPVSVGDPSAVRFCLVGAVIRCYQNTGDVLEKLEILHTGPDRITASTPRLKAHARIMEVVTALDL
jgi:hypothetical protein